MIVAKAAAPPVCADCGEPITFAGKPCGAGHIASGKTCRIGTGPADVSDATIAGARAHKVGEIVPVPAYKAKFERSTPPPPAAQAQIEKVRKEIEKRWATGPADDGYGNSNAFEAADACGWARQGYSGLTVIRDKSGQLAGVMAMMEHKDQIEVRAVGSNPRGGRGQGAAMLAHAARIAGDKGKALTLNPSGAARSFYEKMGMESSFAVMRFTPEKAAAFADQILGPRGRGLSAVRPAVCVDCGEPITFAGKPCGGSYISDGKTCRVGAGGATSADLAAEMNRRTMYHVTTPEAAAAIRAGGIRASEGGYNAFGDGVYLSLDPSDASNTRRTLGGRTEVVKVRVQVSNTYEVSPQAYNGPGGWEASVVREAGGRVSNDGQKITYKGHTVGNGTHEIRQRRAIAQQALKDSGFDSVLFRPEGADRRYVTGGHQLVVFDPGKVRIGSARLSASSVAVAYVSDDASDPYVWHACDLVWQTPANADPTVDKYVWQMADVEWQAATHEEVDAPPCMYCGEPVDFAGKPCGNSFISPGLTCRIGGARGFVDEADWAGYWQGQPTTKPSTAEKNALVDYGSEAYTGVNAALRGGGKMTAKEERTVAGLDSYIERAEPLAEDVVVYRGGRLPPGLKVGSTLKDEAYMSTTGDAQAAGAFARDPSALFQIKVPKGTKAAVMGAALGGQDFESEMVLARGTRLRVTGTDKVKLPYRKIQGGIGWRTQKVMVLEVVP